MTQIVYLKSYLNSFSLDAFYSGVWDTVMLNNLYQEIWKNSLVLMKAYEKRSLHQYKHANFLTNCTPVDKDCGFLSPRKVIGNSKGRRISPARVFKGN